MLSRPRARFAAALVTAVLAVAGVISIPATAAPMRLPISEVRMVNYYPASHGWSAMWTRWDAAEFDRDMARLAGLGANSVRLIVQSGAFGFPTPSATMQQRLAEAVRIADRHRLAVQLTLFDWFSSYGEIDASKRWASAVLAPYAADHRVWSVELQNELPVENPLAVTWAAALLPHLGDRTTAPVTVSVNGDPARLRSLKSLLGAARPDFWSYHYYDQVQASGAYQAFAAAKAHAAPLPLYIGETGVDTQLRSGEDKAAAYARQDHYFRTVFTAARANGLPAPAPWTLWDFAPGSYPGRQWAGQYAFGLYQLDGTAKLAAATVRAAFAGQPLGTGVNNSFENGAATPAQWSRYLPEAASFAVDTTVARTGSRSVRFSRSLGSPTGWPSIWTTPVQPIRPGATYTAAVWAKGRDVTGVNRVGLSWYDSNRRYLGVSASPAMAAGTSDWRQLVARGVAPTGAAVVAIHLQTTRNTGTVWFDDVTFG